MKQDASRACMEDRGESGGDGQATDLAENLLTLLRVKQLACPEAWPGSGLAQDKVVRRTVNFVYRALGVEGPTCH